MTSKVIVDLSTALLATRTVLAPYDDIFFQAE